MSLFYSLLHLFVSYPVPASVLSTVLRTVVSAVTIAPSVVSTAASSAATSAASAASSVGFGKLLRKVALRAVGEEGTAENLHVEQERHVIREIAKAAVRHIRSVREEVAWTTEEKTVSCLDTPGQVFAILLNLLYLLPLV